MRSASESIIENIVRSDLHRMEEGKNISRRFSSEILNNLLQKAVSSGSVDKLLKIAITIAAIF